MRMYLRELDYDNTLIMLAKFMEIREQKPFSQRTHCCYG